MTLNMTERIPIENFTIENNIIKGITDHELPESYQIGKLIFDIFDSKPEHVSQIQAETGEKTTFREMKDHTVRCALWLKKQGIGAGDIITICAGNYLNTYIPLLATLYVGATHNAWNNRTSLKEVQHLIRTIQPKIIFVSEDTAEVIIEATEVENFHGRIIAYDSYPGLESLKMLLQQQDEEEVKNFRPQTLNNPEDIAFIIMTSGSTGFPKGVMQTYRYLIKQIVMTHAFPIKGVVLWYSPCYWITGFLYFMQNLLNCGTRIIHRQFDPEETCKVIAKYEVEHILTTAGSIGYFCKSNVLNKYKLKSLKLVIAGGSKVPKPMLEEFRKSLPHVTVCQAMGTSETGRGILTQTETCKAIDSVGYVLPYFELKVCDLATNKALGPDRLGELCIKFKSSLMMKGYYKNEEATRAVIDDEGWFHTGDIVCYDKNGEFFIVDRLKEIMKYQNHQVSPNEIEEVLISHPGVLEATVVPIPHETDGDHPMAFVKKASDSNVTEEELVKLSEYLGELKKLHGGVKFINEIPKTPNGKIARPILREWAKALA